MKTIKDYLQGERFAYGNKKCMVLEHMEDGILCMVLDSVNCKFGKNNNYEESKLKEDLNGSYLDNWLNNGACFTDFVEMEVDLTADDGLDDYGKCRCFLAPRTCEQHRKYRKLIPNPDGLEWTVTAYSTESNGFFGIACLVMSAGALIYDSGNVYCAYGVRPLFKLNPDAVIVPDTMTVNIPIKTSEPKRSFKAESCEHEFEDLYYCSDDDYMIKTRNVWARRNKGYGTKRLVYCKKCGQVFVKEFEEEGK